MAYPWDNKMNPTKGENVVLDKSLVVTYKRMEDKKGETGTRDRQITKERPVTEPEK